MATEAVLEYLREVYSQPNAYNLSSSKKLTNSSRHQNNSLLAYESTELLSVHDELLELPMSAAHFGLATGLLAILLNSRLLSSKYLKTEVRVNEYKQWAEALFLRVFFATCCLLLSATVAPLVAVAFFFLTFYRQFVHLVLTLTNSSFACLLEGTDAVWALEDDTSKSIINVLVFFEVEIIDNVFKPQLLGMLRKLMKERILTSPESCPKFWQYRRRSRFGYFYWERQKEVRVEEHVQYMTQEDDIVNLEAPDLTEDCFRQEYYGMSESVLKGLVSELANSALPYDNAASWEILVGRDPILEDLSEMDPFEAMEEGNPEASGRYRRYPVLFRVHHSMGDGVALIKLLLETLADKKEAIDQRHGIVTTEILGHDNEEATRLTRRKIFSRLDNIDIVKCSARSFDDVDHDNHKAKRPSFLDLSPNILENSKKKVILDFLDSETVKDNLEGNVDISVYNSSSNVLFTRSTPIEPPADCDVDDEVFDDDLVLSKRDAELDYKDFYHRDLYCYSGTETVVTSDASISVANEIMLNPNKKTIYFDNKKGCEVDALYEKVIEYSPPPSGKIIHLFRDESPPPLRCKSPMPPFKRDVSRIERVMDEIIDSRSRSCAPLIKDDSFSSGSESYVAIAMDETPRRDSIFLIDNSPPMSTSLAAQPSHVNSQYHRSEAARIIRNESPAPKIHRKKYPVLYYEEDSEDSPPTSRKELSFSRSSSPFPRDNSPAPFQNKVAPQHPRKNALRLQNEGLVSRSTSPIPRFNSSRANSPFLMNATPVLRKVESPPRCHSPILKNYSPLHNKNSTPRCTSPFMRNNSPLPRNDKPIPRNNSPFMRNDSPLCRNDKPIPRCDSPFMRNNSATPLTAPTISRPNSQFQNDDSPRRKNAFVHQNNPLYLTNSCYNLRYNDLLLGKPTSNLSTVNESGFTCSYVESTDDIQNKTSKNETKGGKKMQDVPLALNSSSTFTEHFIRHHFFSPDGEVFNRSSITPNCFIKLLDSINDRPGRIEKICNNIKNACALVFAPASLIHQTMVKAADINPLHGPDLSGQKVVSWYYDSYEDESDNLLSTIKRIKTRMSDARFTDVFLSALSSSLESYFLRSGCDIPETVSVVIPVRMTTHEEIAEAIELNNRETGNTNNENDSDTKDTAPKIPEMENKFSVALLSLPLMAISPETKMAKPFSVIGRLREICKHTDILRKSPDYHINYWLMRVVSTYLPLPLLAPMLNSTQSTMVVSNLMGPPTQLEMGGYHLKDIVFWVPNRGSTGVGVSVLSYAGRLQIGIMADRALIPCQQDANIIIDGIISELKCLDEITAPIKTHPLKV